MDSIEKYGYSSEIIKKKIDLLFKYNPEDAHAFYFLGILYRPIDIPLAIGYFEKAIEINSQLPDAYFKLGNIYDFEEGFDSVGPTLLRTCAPAIRI